LIRYEWRAWWALFDAAMQRLRQSDADCVDEDERVELARDLAAAISVRDGALVGLLLLDEDEPRIGRYRQPDRKSPKSESGPQPNTGHPD
jgi:hypothetical protein